MKTEADIRRRIKINSCGHGNLPPNNNNNHNNNNKFLGRSNKM